MFKGLGNEGPNQFLFIVKAVWEAHGIIDDKMKRETLVSMLQEHVLMWYIKDCNDNPTSALEDIQIALNKEFSIPKSKVQSIVRFKEIMMKPGETP